MVTAALIDTLSRIGAIGGILSIIGVGLLILLVAAQSRQIRSMQDWIDEEPQRQQEVAQRVIAEVQRRIAAARERRAGQPAQAVPAIPGVPRAKPAPGTLGATPEAQKLAAKKDPADVTLADGTPGAFPPATAAGGADAPAFAPLTPAGASESDVMADEIVVPIPSDDDEPAVVSEFMGQETQAADALPDDDFSTAPPMAASSPRDVRFGENEFDLEDEEQPRSNRLLFGVGAAALLAGIVLLGYLLFGTGDDTPTTSSNAGSSDTPAETTASTSPGSSTPAQIDPATVNVRVFNGTTITGLAQRVTDDLKAKGYSTGAPETLSTNQTATTTTVSYREGSKSAATQVAEELGLSASAVRAIDADTSVAAGETAEVVVVTGADLDNGSSGSTPE